MDGRSNFCPRIEPADLFLDRRNGSAPTVILRAQFTTFVHYAIGLLSFGVRDNKMSHGNRFWFQFCVTTFVRKDLTLVAVCFVDILLSFPQ